MLEAKEESNINVGYIKSTQLKKCFTSNLGSFEPMITTNNSR